MRAAELITLFGLSGLEKRYRTSSPADNANGRPSPGRWRRSRVSLLDEPFGAVDAKIRQELREWLVTLHHDLNRDDHLRHAIRRRRWRVSQSHRDFSEGQSRTDRHAARSP